MTTVEAALIGSRGGESLAATDRVASEASLGRWGAVVLVLLVLIPASLNAVAFWPELTLPLPNLNDGAVHYLLIQRASEALGAGESPFDHWVPELELGLPMFLYYQHLPHLVVVALHWLLLKQVSLLTLFNLIRYLLLVCFPLTVYWSMRRLGFSAVAGAVAAAASTLLVSNHGYGLEYNSYTWGGHGMYTQLWAMHLSFIWLALLHGALERGRGWVGAVVASSLLALSHLIYAYMMAPAALVLLLAGLSRTNAWPRIARLLLIGGATAVITAYLWLPFVMFKAYLNASPNLPRWRYDSFGAGDVLTWLANGEVLDHGRLPVLTVLLALGVAWTILARTRPAWTALGLLVLWVAFYFGRPTWGRGLDLLPMSEGVPLHRLIGAVHIGALLLIGLGGEWLWRQSAPLPGRWRAVAVGLVLVALLAPAVWERQAYYKRNTGWMERAEKALDADPDARAMLAALTELPPGRAYVGLRSDWGKDLAFGDLHFYDLLTFNRIKAVTPPYGSTSLSAELLWFFDYRNPVHYDLFNVRYLVAPRGLEAPGFLQPIKETRRYILYQTRTGGYARFAAIGRRMSFGSQAALLAEDRSWLFGPDMPAGQFTRYDYPATVAAPASPDQPDCTGLGRIDEKRVWPSGIDVRVECPRPSSVIFKMGYHPKWQAAIDGRPARPFMVSGDSVGLDVPAGAHDVSLEYRTGALQIALMLVGACALAATVALGRRFESLPPASRRARS